MRLTQDQIKEFESLVKPLIEWMYHSCDPHMITIINDERAELKEGLYETGKVSI